ncbi:hypothetical protein PV08_09011 [Exophiala spinifera]|uniref:RING-type domain-containing protein n=1 Tax=Exophiala spinifera TaxID=91928 RepID=A0A0D2BKC8_9EURO|nr:uncharacterized protein PV08_09011 [Exophiala spinifera]KIW11739.1 hypothetical protein PV08_09011 [Exophiala spinifera]
MQPTLNLDHFLTDDDCDIGDEYASVVDAALDMRRKFSSVLRQARQLKTTLQAKQADLEHERQRLELRTIAETSRNKLRQQSRRLRQCKDDNRSLRLQNQELASRLEVARKELEKVDHLRCTLCTVAFKDAMLPCGHTACRVCLDLWIGQGNDCPWCRRSFEVGDIRDLYLADPSATADALEEDGDVTDVISLASDSE